MSKNQAILEKFAAKFDPPPQINAVQEIDGVPVKDGFMCTHLDEKRNIGVTAVTFGDGEFKGHIEAIKKDDEHGTFAARTGLVFNSAILNMWGGLFDASPLREPWATKAADEA